MALLNKDSSQKDILDDEINVSAVNVEQNDVRHIYDRSDSDDDKVSANHD